jgi:competence protein ComEC
MIQQLWLRGALLLTLVLVAVISFLPPDWSEQAAALIETVDVMSDRDVEFLTVAFLDVGQGDAIFIETPDGVQLLIDGGPDNGVLRELARQMSPLDRTIDIVLATHSDKDHIGGLVDVLKRYEVAAIVTTTNQNDTSVARTFTELIQLEGADLYTAQAGQQYQLGASTTLFILSPLGDPTNWESNSASIVALLEYGDTSFMLTGDAGINTEEYLVSSYGDYLKSDVLKLGHHGSKTSSGDVFLDTVRPHTAVVSAGQDNSYGHPHPSVVSLLEERDIKILETAKEGTIIFKSDGERVWLEG